MRTMRNVASLGCGIALALSALLCRSSWASWGMQDGSYLNKVTMEVATPHLTWAKPLAGGPVKALFIVPRWIGAREVVELAQRMDLDFKAVTIAFNDTFALTDKWEAALSGVSPAEKAAELSAALERHYDVIVIAGSQMGCLPVEAQFKIVQHVADGGGLLFTYNTSVPIKKLLDHTLPDAPGQIADGIGWEGLPPGMCASVPKNVIRGYAFGKGRVAVLAYPVGIPTNRGWVSLTETQNFSESWWSAYETNMALVTRAMLWSAGRLPRATVSLDSKTLPASAADLQTKGVTLLVSSKELRQIAVSLRWRMDDNTLLEEQERSAALDHVAEGHPETHWAEFTFKPKQCPVGAMHLDAIVRSDQGVETIGTWTLKAQGPLSGAALATDLEAYEADQPVHVTVTGLATADRPLTLRIQLADMPYHQVWLQRETLLRAGQAEWTGEFTLPPDWPTPAGIVLCELRRGDQLQARLTKYVFFPRHRRPLYSRYAWGIVPACLAPMYAQQVVEGLGWHCGLVWPDPAGEGARVMALFNQRLLPYLTRICITVDADGRTQCMGPWGTPEAKASTKNDQSFYNLKVKELWKNSVEMYAANQGRYDPLVYSLGDENNFSYEAGYTPSEEAAFREFLRKRYGRIEDLNREWQTHFTDFDSVQHYSLKDLKKDKRYPAWYDHRCFMEQEYADVHHFLADCVRAKDPHTGIGAEGSDPGNLEETIQGLEFWGPYGDSIGGELLRSIGADRLRTNWWGGYLLFQGDRERGYPVFLWHSLLLGDVNGSAWFNANVWNEGMLAADFSYPDFVKQLESYEDRLTRGIGTLLVDQPLRPDGIAVLWSHASDSMAAMAPDFLGPGNGAAVFTDFCHRAGLQFDYVTSAMIERGALKPYKFLFVPGAVALSEAEDSRIAEFAEQGGVVVADFKPGVLNEHCRALNHSSLATFFDYPDLRADTPMVSGPLKVQQTVRGKNFTFRAQKVSQVRPAQDGVSPLLRSHNVGKGLAILLNFALDYAGKTCDAATPMEGFFLDLVSLAGVQPMVTVQGADRKTEFYVLRLRQKGDCLTVGLQTSPKDVGKTVTITLPEAMFAYRADEGFLAQGRQVSLHLDWPFQVLCLFPKEQAAPRLVTQAPGEIHAGETLRFDAGGLNKDSDYRIEVLDPNGHAISRRMQLLSGSSLAAGATLSVPFAWNDASGKYTIVLTDLRTGLKDKYEVNVRGALAVGT